MSGVVVGVDSSTQSCKVLVVEVGTGRTVASATAPHPEGTAIDPRAWVEALRRAWDAAGVRSRGDLLGVGVSAQQHGMVAVDPQGRPVHDALLWNDTRSADQAARLIADLGIGSWMEATNVLPVPSITLTKLAWLREHEPQAAARVQRVMLPHDWLVMHLTGAFATDRSDASGTGYFDATSNRYRLDLLDRYFGAVPELPAVLEPGAVSGTLRPEWGPPVPVSAGCVDVLRAIEAPVEQVLLIGGGAGSAALRVALTDTLSMAVAVPEPREYVALGAARQAAWAATGELPRWGRRTEAVLQPGEDGGAAAYRARYIEARSALVSRGR